MHDPTKFPNIYFSKKKGQHKFCLFRFKVPIHKKFRSTHSSPQDILSRVLYYYSVLFSSSLSRSNTSLLADRSIIYVPNLVDAFAPTTILTLQTKPSLPSWMTITLTIGYLSIFGSSRNKTISQILKFLTILLNLCETCKIA